MRRMVTDAREVIHRRKTFSLKGISRSATDATDATDKISYLLIAMTLCERPSNPMILRLKWGAIRIGSTASTGLCPATGISAPWHRARRPGTPSPAQKLQWTAIGCNGLLNKPCNRQCRSNAVPPKSWPRNRHNRCERAAVPARKRNRFRQGDQVENESIAPDFHQPTLPSPTRDGFSGVLVEPRFRGRRTTGVGYTSRCFCHAKKRGCKDEPQIKTSGRGGCVRGFAHGREPPGGGLRQGRRGRRWPRRRRPRWRIFRLAFGTRQQRDALPRRRWAWLWLWVWRRSGRIVIPAMDRIPRRPPGGATSSVDHVAHAASALGGEPPRIKKTRRAFRC
jgi:hypothetical protein